eukprot:80333-Chlamydomonas_euryale.AAC.3
MPRWSHPMSTHRLDASLVTPHEHAPPDEVAVVLHSMGEAGQPAALPRALHTAATRGPPS